MFKVDVQRSMRFFMITKAFFIRYHKFHDCTEGIVFEAFRVKRRLIIHLISNATHEGLFWAKIHLWEMFHSWDTKQNTHPGQVMRGVELNITLLELLGTSCVHTRKHSIAIDFDKTKKIL